MILPEVIRVPVVIISQRLKGELYLPGKKHIISSAMMPLPRTLQGSLTVKTIYRTGQQFSTVISCQHVNNGGVLNLGPLATMCCLQSPFKMRKCKQQINEVSEENVTEETEDQPVSGRCSQEDYQTIASPSKVCLCCKKQYPVNNMISGYVHIDQMKKYSGELHDFIPSFHGHSVSRSNE